jgi:hypothetical protein
MLLGLPAAPAALIAARIPRNTFISDAVGRQRRKETRE